MQRNQAERDIRWLYTESLGEACSLRGTHYRVVNTIEEGLAEVSETGHVRRSAFTTSSGTARNRNFRGAPADAYPDEKAQGRQRLREVSRAIASIPTQDRAILEAFLDTGRPGRREQLGLEEGYVEVAAMLPDVVERAFRNGITRRQSVRMLVMDEGPDAVRARVAPLVERALDRYLEACA